MEKSNGLDDNKTDSDMVKVTPAATANPIPECEMDALLLGRIGELVSITPNERNWRGICIALLVIVAILAVILLFIMHMYPVTDGPFNPGIKFSIDQVTGIEFKSASFNGTWISENEFVFRDSNGGVSIFNVKNNSVQVLMDNSPFRLFNGVDFSISSDLKYILLVKDIEFVQKNMKKAKYCIQDIYSSNHIPLTPFAQHKNCHDSKLSFIQEVMWSPINNALFFVHKNNIFYKPEAMSNTVVPITNTGSDFVYNGVPDWLYQEEITKNRKCMWISSDGKYLVFVTFNDTLVGKFKYPVFKTNYQYPEIFSIPYPKVGTRNPEVTVSVVHIENLQNGSQTDIKKVELFSNSDVYFINVIWSKTNQFAVVWMNRLQTISIISICSKPHWNCHDVITANVTGDGSWVEPSPDLIFSSSGNGFITILSMRDGARRYPQICFVNISTGLETPITYGRIVVTSIKAWDESNKVIYFEAAPENKPSQRHIYNVSDSLTPNNDVYCLTCPVSEISNNANATNNITFNISSLLSSFGRNNINNRRNRTKDWSVRSNACLFVTSHFYTLKLPIRYYVLECLGPEVPKIFVMNITTNFPSYLWNNQTELAAKYAKMAKPHVRILQVDLDSGYRAQVKLLVPAGQRDQIDMEFPFILYIGTRPGGQGVTEKWTVDWNTYLVGSLNFVVGIIDARGSNYQNDEAKFEIKNKIGVVDIEDQLFVLRYLRENLKFIDPTRAGVWGSGYGGYLTSKFLGQDNGTFQCGVAVAPITSWAHYVSVWTERFMATPNVTDNYRGYEESDLTKNTTRFKDKKLLLMHGTADKIVHFQHTMLLVHSFIKTGVLFRHLTYPDDDHDFAGSSKHVVKAMDEFWTECFGTVEYKDYDEGLGFLSLAQ